MKQSDLRLLLSYNSDKGSFEWKERPLGSKTWNARYAGKPALTSVSCNGYKVGAIFNKTVYAHRIAWLYTFGFIPDKMDIDHINRDKSDNRISNLRLAYRSDNNANTISRKGSTSVYLGVHWSNRYKKWVAQITKGYKSSQVGKYDSEIEAAIAYDNEARIVHGEHARLNFNSGSRANRSEDRADRQQDFNERQTMSEGNV